MTILTVFADRQFLRAEISCPVFEKRVHSALMLPQCRNSFWREVQVLGKLASVLSTRPVGHRAVDVWFLDVLSHKMSYVCVGGTTYGQVHIASRFRRTSVETEPLVDMSRDSPRTQTKQPNVGVVMTDESQMCIPTERLLIGLRRSVRECSVNRM